MTVFADFKYTRSFFDATLAATPFYGDAFKGPNGLPNLARRTISVPIQNPFNPFTVGGCHFNLQWCPCPSNYWSTFRAINDERIRTDKTTFHDVLFDTGLRGEMGEFGDYFKSWNWELGFRYSRNDEELLFGGVGEQLGPARSAAGYESGYSL